MSTRIAHVAVAPSSVAEALRFYELVGLAVEHREEVHDQGVRVAMMPVGDSSIELLEATTPDSPVARFLQRRGPGIHHLCLEVDQLAETLHRLKAAGVRLIDESPREGAGGCRIAFVHPQSTGGVLVELSEKPDGR